MPDMGTGVAAFQLQTPYKWPLPCGLDGLRRESPSPLAVLVSDLFSNGRWRRGGLFSRGDFQVEPPLNCLRAAVPKVDTAHQLQTGKWLGLLCPREGPPHPPGGAPFSGAEGEVAATQKAGHQHLPQEGPGVSL